MPVPSKLGGPQGKNGPKPPDRPKTEPVMAGLRQVQVTPTEEQDEDLSSLTWFADVLSADSYGGRGKWFFTVYSTATAHFWRKIVDTSCLNTPGELDLGPILSAPFKITDWKPSLRSAKNSTTPT